MANLLSHPAAKPMVFPSILGADFANLANECEQVLGLGAEALHVDVMDGHFVPNLTMGPALVRSLKKRFPDAFFDVHLMTTDPQQWVEPFAEAGADHLSYHIEATAGRDEHNEHDLIEQIHRAGCTAGVVINPPTPAVAIEHLLDKVDLVLVMSVHPGFAGQSFMDEVLDKTRRLAGLLPERVRLQMDGGIGPQNIGRVLEAGCDTVVAASSLFGAANRAEALAALRGGA